MFLVGGGILGHGVPFLHHGVEALAAQAGTVPGIGGALGFLLVPAADMLIGIAAGALVLAGVSLATKLRPKKKAAG